MQLERAGEFFALARERYNILLRRREGQPRPWTSDDILRQFKFCNVFREDDATTIWIKENIRDPLREDGFAMPAMAVCRWFNRIGTLEVLRPMLLERRWDSVQARELLKDVSPLVTAAYLVSSPRGMTKLDGLLWAIDQAHVPLAQRGASMVRSSRPHTIEETTEYLARFNNMGDFLAYEVASDLVHTKLLANAPDIMTWANPGPGATRGISRLVNNDLGKPLSRGGGIEVMRELLRLSQDPENWPAEWPSWTMREVEHTLCEFDKYERTRLGEGTPKQKFDGGGVTTFRYGQFGRNSHGGTVRGTPTVKDPIQAAVNKKIGALRETLSGQISEFIDRLVAKAMEDFLIAIPENVMPSLDYVLLDPALWPHGPVQLRSPRRLPAYFQETGVPIPQEYREEVQVLAAELEELEVKQDTLYRQIQELLS